MAHPRRFRGGHGARRATSWLDVEPTSVTVDTSISVISHSLNALEQAKRPFTVVRSHLHLHIRSDQLAADEPQFGAVGICVISDQAQAIGISAVPTPLTDLASDLWFLHGMMSSDFAFLSAVGFDGSSGQSYDFDSKAMRKVNDDEDVIIVIETASISNGAQYLISGRVLIKEH